MNLLGAIAGIPGVNAGASALIGGVDKLVPGSPGQTLANNINNPNINYQGQANPTFNFATAGTGVKQPTAASTPLNAGGANPDGSTNVGVAAPDLSSYDQGINELQGGLTQLDPQAAVGHQNILDAYTTAYNTLLGQKAQAQQQYTTNKNTEGQNYVTDKNTIGAGVGSAINSAERLLGSRGAGSSSAALFNAPQAAARQGSLERNAAGQTFSQNNQSLDQGWGDFNNNWNTSATGLGTQRDQQNNALDSSIAQNRANLLQQIAGLQTQRAAASGMTTAQAVAAGQPYINQANTLLSQATNLGLNYANPVIQATPVQYQAPSLASYTAGEQGPTTLANPSGLTDSVSPYVNLLLGKKQTNPIGA